MIVLGIDTTKKSAKIFLIDTKNSSLSKFINLDENVRHSEGLFVFVDDILNESQLTLKDIDVFACVVGPGSFTGIRVGMSAIKGFNKVVNKSVLSMSSFDILLQDVENGTILLSSTATSCYYAKIKNSKITDTGVVNKTEIENFAQGDEVVVLKEEQDVINLEYKNIRVIENIDTLIEECIISKLNTMDYGEFVPYYLQLSQAERNCK